MIFPIAALWAAALAALTSVVGVRVIPAADMTEIVIEVDGPVTYRDFRLDAPARIVLDLTGARHALGAERFAGIDRGGVRGIRVSQHQPEVVRVVIDVERLVDYRVDADGRRVRIVFGNPDETFAPWSSVPGAARPAAAALAAPAAAVPAVVAAPAAPRAEARRITVSFRDSPLLDVLSTFAEFSGRSIVSGRQVSGSVTADIRGQPWDIALEAILQSHGLAAREMESGIIRVAAIDQMREAEKVEDLVTRQFRIRYANADSLVETVRGLLSERGRVTRNSATNSLIVTDGRSVLERLDPFVEQLDVRTPQVTIAAKIIFVDRTALEEFGIVYDLKDTHGHQFNQMATGARNTAGLYSPDTRDFVRLNGSSLAALANANHRVQGPALQVIGSLVLGQHSLFAFIEALGSLSLTDIQAAPVVTTMDNRQARIQVGEETPIRVIDVAGGAGVGAGTDGGAAAPRATVQMKQTGIILDVTPHITGDQVLLELHAERSHVALAPGDIGVTFVTQKSNTHVLLRDGETAVIGGLTVVETSQLRAGIPILMDLPGIGFLFRKTSTRENKKDLLFMVTPHIVRDGDLAPSPGLRGS
jgi:type IV pilus assembly protein PilQ